MSADTEIFLPSFAESALIRTKQWQFEVDGKDFPWYISARGPIVTRYYDDIWSIDVEIFALDQETKKTLPIELNPMNPRASSDAVPIIGGVKFPWVMSKDGWKLLGGSRRVLTLHTAFLARDVDTDGEVDDLRAVWADRAFYANGGDCWKSGKDKCYWCKEWVDDLWDHHKQVHPEHVTTTKEGHQQIEMGTYDDD